MNYDIGIVVKEFPPDKIGGAETQTKRMGQALVERGHSVTVFTKRYESSHDDTDVDYEVVRIPNLRIHPLLSDLTFLIGTLLTLLVRRNDFDVLQCMMIYPNGFLGYLVNKLTGLPYFAWIRGNDFYVGKDVWWKRWMIRRVLEDTLVLVQSSEIETDVREEFPDLEPDLQVLGNGVDIPEEPRPDPEENRILFVGRFAPKKGLNYLFDAMEMIDQDCELVLVGDGTQRKHLERRAEQLDITVRFEGFVPPDQVDEFYREASVFVLPSTEGEGMPNAVLEARAWGVPVVATESGGLPTIIENQSTGILVPMRDSNALAESVSDLLERISEGRNEIGSAGRNYIHNNHSWSTIADELEVIYQHLL